MASAAAYGFRIEGIDLDGALALDGADHWPALHLERRGVVDPGAPRTSVTASHASIQTPAAHIRLVRATRHVLVCARGRVSDAELVHPSLWPAAAVFARWEGGETLHAGAFIDADGGAWAVLGDRGAGKSTLLAMLALAGHRVLVDDMLVVRGTECFAGPRCIDLRHEAVARLGLERMVSAVRATERGRLPLPRESASAPLRGLIYLDWSDELEIEPIAPAVHLGLLAAHRRIAVLGAEVGLLLDLAGLPAVWLRRPRSWEGVGVARDALVTLPKQL